MYVLSPQRGGGCDALLGDLKQQVILGDLV